MKFICNTCKKIIDEKNVIIFFGGSFGFAGGEQKAFCSKECINI